MLKGEEMKKHTRVDDHDYHILEWSRKDGEVRWVCPCGAGKVTKLGPPYLKGDK